MTNCEHCGHELGGGLFCTRCGSRLPRADVFAGPGEAIPSRLAELRSDTAERPAVVAAPPAPPVVPAPAAPPVLQVAPDQVPSNARFPLFADEVHPIVPAPSASPDPAYLPAPRHAATGPILRAPSLPWPALAAVALLAVVAVALWLVFRPVGDGPGATPGRDGDPTAAGPSTASAGPDETAAAAGGRPREVAGSATAVVPAVAPPNLDVSGSPVRYGADRLFDGDATSTWRMPGDGTGELLTIRLARTTEVRRVGLVNGYAKTDVDDSGRTVRWYLRNRRILAVRWSFDDGSVVTQRLDQRPRLQRVDVGGEVTRTIRLRLVRVSTPKAGRLGRDYTAISEISIIGTPR